MSTLQDAIGNWKLAARTVVEARAAYVRSYAEALGKSDAKNAEGRKADADVGALTERMALEFAEIEEHSAKWTVYALIPRTVSPFEMAA
jgi:hypothetical protein